MSRAPAHPPLRRRKSRRVPRTVSIGIGVIAAIALTTIVATLADAIGRPPFGGRHGSPGGLNLLLAARAPVGKGVSLDFPLAIHTGLAGQYETTVLLETNSPITLQLDYDAPALAGYEQRVRWRCDRGRLERDEETLRNRFFPPSFSTVSTIEADVAFHPKREGKTQPTAVFTKKATLRAISLSPGSALHKGELDGFRIGEYLDPQGPGVRSETYAALYPEKFQPPRAFYLVDNATRDLRISRHLRLGDLALDYPWFSLGKRQYIALDHGLVRKVEDLIEEMNRAGLPGDKFRIIYGFRPPAYNLERIAQDSSESLKAPFSLHQYGRAIDFILDADGDLRLDDLDGDGKTTVRDAAVIVHHVNVLDRRYRSQNVPLYGGAGLYDHHDFWERPVQSPYVHMDVRGFLDENGNLIRWPAKWADTGEMIPWGKL